MHKAGEVIMSIYATDFSVRSKNNSSPVTEADEKAEELILSDLMSLTPDVPIVSEEAAAAGKIPGTKHIFWLVDPLDGTKEFINRNNEFTVNIALIENGQPILGAVYAPALDRLYAGVVGEGAFLEENGIRRPITVRKPPVEGLTIVASRSHGDAATLEDFLKGYKIANLQSAGSSLKLCLVACGQADLYPRLGRTMEWDIAAGHAVLAAAGGSLIELNGKPLHYGKIDFANPYFVAMGLVN
jgi:3'(2'), 5'-bisphosphate nucleotidase